MHLLCSQSVPLPQACLPNEATRRMRPRNRVAVDPPQAGPSQVPPRHRCCREASGQYGGARAPGDTAPRELCLGWAAARTRPASRLPRDWLSPSVSSSPGRASAARSRQTRRLGGGQTPPRKGPPLAAEPRFRRVRRPDSGVLVRSAGRIHSSPRWLRTVWLSLRRTTTCSSRVASWRDAMRCAHSCECRARRAMCVRRVCCGRGPVLAVPVCVAPVLRLCVSLCAVFTVACAVRVREWEWGCGLFCGMWGVAGRIACHVASRVSLVIVRVPSRLRLGACLCSR